MVTTIVMARVHRIHHLNSLTRKVRSYVPRALRVDQALSFVSVVGAMVPAWSVPRCPRLPGSGPARQRHGVGAGDRAHRIASSGTCDPQGVDSPTACSSCS